MAKDVEQERWASVLGFAGRYEVSDQGRVRSFPKRGVQGRILGCHERSGYYRVALTTDGRTKWREIHRVVWEAFTGAPIPKGLQINHLNGDKSDNSLANLEMCTPSENMRHSYSALGRERRAPTRRRGEQNPRAKLKSTDLATIASLRSSGMTQKEIAGRFAVTQGTISAFLRGLTWQSPQPD